MSSGNSSSARRAWLARSALWVTLTALPLWATAQQASPSLLLMAGAGYKRPLEAICNAFTQDSGIAVERSYGNLQQVIAQARASGRVDMLVGDADFIDKARDLAMTQRQSLGQGILVLAWRKGLEPRPDAGAGAPAAARAWLATPGLSLAMPNAQQAIYGNAARQWLQAQGQWDAVQERLKTVGMVPQVSAYLSSGQVDLGFMNLTEALAVQEQLGGFVRLAPGAESYAPIEIVAALPPASEHPDTLAAREALMRFLAGAKAQELLRRAGL